MSATALATLLEYRVDGVILVSPRMQVSDIRAAAAEVPVVMVGRQVRGIDADFVIIDEGHGVELVLEHLLAPRPRAHRPRRRRHGSRADPSAGPPSCAACAAAGWVADAAVIRGDFTEEAGVSAARELLAGPDLPTAVFAANDLVAAGLLGGFDQAGVEVPGDVSIVGYDNISIAHLAHVSLTTVHQPRSAMGQMALELLLDRIDNRRRSVVRVVEPSLVVRSTTAPPRASWNGA